MRITIELSTLVYDVRDELSSIPDDLISSEQIYKEIKKANIYINYIIDPDWDDEDIQKQTIVSLASYYSYVNYTALVSSQRDDVSDYVYKREKVLKDIALSFLRMLAKYPISTDLSVDEKLLAKMGAVAYVNTNSVWS